MASPVLPTQSQPPLVIAEILPQDAKDVAHREWNRLTDDLARVRTAIAELRSQQEVLESQVAAWSVILAAGRSETDSEGDAAVDRPPEGGGTLPTPQESADAVVDLLQEANEPLHYRAIYEILRGRGMEVRGKNPPNTLLARFFDDPRLERVGQGTYRIKRHEGVPLDY